MAHLEPPAFFLTVLGDCLQLVKNRVDLVKNRTTKETAPVERDAILQHCFSQGLVLLGCGESAIRLCPALVVTKEEAETAVKILDAAIAETERTAAMAHSGGIGP